jgi:hemoglobin
MMVHRMKIVLLTGLMLVGCFGASSRTTMADTSRQKSLYERLGGRDGIAAVIADFSKRIGSDDRVSARFMNTDVTRLHLKVAEQLCEVTGGPCKYTGMDMKTAHAGMTLTDDELNVMLEDFKVALEHLQVPAREQRELLGILGSMRSDIVGK